MRYGVNQATAQWRIVDGEAVIVNTDSTYYYGLNPSGTFVWSLLTRQPLTLEEIVARVSARYDLAAPQVEADVAAIVQSLRDEDLVKEIADGAQEEANAGA